MANRYYISYGSNMLREHMKIRTPDAVIVGKSVLKGWQLIFRYGADIIENEGFETPVIIWKISEQDEKNLDEYEDYPSFYIKRDMTLPVTSLDGKDLGELTAMVYIMPDEAVKEKSSNPVPPHYYYSVIEKAYEDFGFDKKILKEALEEAKSLKN